MRPRIPSPAHRRTTGLLAGRAAAVPVALLLGGCSDLQLASPGWLWLLWLVPVALAFYLWSFRARRRLLERIADAPLGERLAAGVRRGRQALRAGLVLLALLAGLLSLAGPRFGFTWEEVQRRGVDIIVALDVSDSMLVEDVESGGGLSRLERAKREISDLLTVMEGDRIGLVAFAGEAFVECPLTLDYGAAAIFLDAIDTDLIPVKGTDLARALRVAAEGFGGGASSSRAVILITDGEDHGGEALAAAEEAAAAGIRVFAIGIGRDEGAPIPAGAGGFRRDRRGELVLSRLDEATLQRIALATGGRYVRSVSGDLDLEQIYSGGIKAVLEDQELDSRRRRRWEERFQWLVALALGALMVEPLIPTRAGGTAGSRAAGRVAALLAVVALAAPQAARSAAADPYRSYEQGRYEEAVEGFLERRVRQPDEPAWTLNLGSAHYKLDSWEEAERAFATVAAGADPELRQEALYDLGNTLYRQGRLAEAVEAYKRSLELDPDDFDAKFNLEFVREELRRQQQQQQQQQQQEQGQGQQEQQEEQEGQDPGQGQGRQEEQRPEDGDPGGEPRPRQDDRSDTGPQGERPPASDASDGPPEELDRAGEGPAEPADPGSDREGPPEGPSQPPPASMTPEEAERYLQALEEGRPDLRLPAEGRARQVEKDW